MVDRMVWCGGVAVLCPREHGSGYDGVDRASGVDSGSDDCRDTVPPGDLGDHDTTATAVGGDECRARRE